MVFTSVHCRSQGPRGLRRRYAAARLLRLWVRIPQGARMFVVSVVCCQIEVSASIGHHYSKIRVKHINTLCRKNVDFFYLQT
jgi:hypothetical protein